MATAVDLARTTETSSRGRSFRRRHLLFNHAVRLALERSGTIARETWAARHMPPASEAAILRADTAAARKRISVLKGAGCGRTGTIAFHAQLTGRERSDD